MRTSIQSLNIELDKEENIATAIELQELLFQGCKTKEERLARAEAFPLLNKLYDLTTQAAQANELRDETTLFKYIPRS